MGVTAYSLGRLSLLAALLHIGVGHAQTSVTPTRLQGDLKTNVTFGGGAYDITGGTRSDNKTGPNLFHSFQTFGLAGGETANFKTDGYATSNIIGRVTGGPGATSYIYGTINTLEFGNANLFLINPAGWVFGPGATLQVGG